MTPKDLIYKHTFALLTNKGFQQKIAGDYAARACYLWAHGRSHDEAIKQAVKEAGKTKKNKRTKAA